MARRIMIRPLLEDLLQDTDLIITYIELPNGGFDLSVRYVDDIDDILNVETKIPNKL